MGIYDFNLAAFGQRMLPPDKRGTGLFAYLKNLLVPLQWDHDLRFTDYWIGSTASNWVSGTYNTGARAIYGISVYESLIDGNTDQPNMSENWIKIQENFVGLRERLLYNGGTLSVTWALNRRFMTSFRQPPALSDIYLVPHTKPASSFIVGYVESESSDVFTTGSSEVVVDSYMTGAFYNLTIMVPVAVYNALDPIAANRDKIIRSFADKIIIAGITYNIQTY